jgi:hypothetical protein
LEEEQEAEISIHQEALERSRGNASALGKSYLEEDDDDDDDDASRPMDDYGGGGNDDHDDDDDNDGYGFGTWGTPTMRGNGGGVVAMPPSALRGRRPFLDISPSSDPNSVNNHQTSAILDAMVSSQVFLDNTQSDYSYFDTQALMEKMQIMPNQWAGSAHWKKMDRLRQPKHNKDSSSTKENTTPDDDEADDDDMNTATASTKKKKKKTTSKAKKEPVLVNLAAPPTPEQLRQLYAKPPQKKGKTTRGKKGTTTPDPLQWSKTMIAKLEKMDNLLPKDVGVGLEQLTTLFLRPDVNLALLHNNNNNVSHVEKAGFLKSVGMYFNAWGTFCASPSRVILHTTLAIRDSIS